jgi:hypothetical protein
MNRKSAPFRNPGGFHGEEYRLLLAHRVGEEQSAWIEGLADGVEV